MIKEDHGFKKNGATGNGELPDDYSLREEPAAQDDCAKADGAVSRYYQEIAHIRALSSEEAKALWDAKQRGDSAARDRIIEANTFLVIAIAMKYKNRGIELIDLIGAGNCGLVKAVDNYNPLLGYSFSTYAHMCIGNEIKKALEQSDPVRISPENYRRKKQADDERERLEQLAGKRITNAELAESLGWSLGELERVLKIGDALPVSLDADSSTEDSTDGLGKLIPDPKQEDPQDTLVKSSMQHDVQESLEVLTAQEKAVIKLAYGMYDGIRHKYSDIERMLDLRKGTARQIELRGLEKLRDYRVLIKLIAYSEDRSMVDWADSLQSVKTEKDPR